MFNYKSNISIDVLYDDVKRQQDDIREQWKLYEELRRRVNGLYAKDAHNTERPKVDILHDSIDNNIGEEIHDLRVRIIELEQKKK